MRKFIFSLLWLYGLTIALPGALWAEDAADKIMKMLGERANGPAELASIEHQKHLLNLFSIEGLLESALLGRPEARSTMGKILRFRVAIALSDAGKLSYYKEWFWNPNTDQRKEFLACLQGPEGKIWEELGKTKVQRDQLKRKYTEYMAAIKENGLWPLNPKMTSHEVAEFFAMKNNPMAVGFFHEWQGSWLAFDLYKEATNHQRGFLHGLVENHSQYLEINRGIYGHNGGGPDVLEFIQWLESHPKHNRIFKFFNETVKVKELPPAVIDSIPPAKAMLALHPELSKYSLAVILKLVPFWSQAHAMLRDGKSVNGRNALDGTSQHKTYINADGSKGGAESITHQNADRLEGADFDPYKIDLEVRGLKNMLLQLDVYAGSGPISTGLLQDYTREKTLPKMVDAGIVDLETAQGVSEFYQNNAELGQLVFRHRLSKMKFLDANGNELDYLAVAREQKRLSTLIIITHEGPAEFHMQEDGKTFVESGTNRNPFDLINEEIAPIARETFKRTWSPVRADRRCNLTDAATALDVVP